MIKTKLFIVLFLLVSLECHTIASIAKMRKTYRRLGEDEVAEEIELKQPQTVLDKIKATFKKFYTDAQNSKLFNFLFGAVLKIINMLQGNAVMECVKCVFNAIEVYFIAKKFPEKSLDDLKTEVMKKEELPDPNQLADKENSDDGLGEDMGRSEMQAMKVDCKTQAVVMDFKDKTNDPDFDEVKASVIDGEDDVEEIIQANEDALEDIIKKEEAEEAKKKGK